MCVEKELRCLSFRVGDNMRLGEPFSYVITSQHLIVKEKTLSVLLGTALFMNGILITCGINRENTTSTDTALRI